MAPIQRSTEFSGNPVAMFVQSLDAFPLRPEIIRAHRSLGSIGPSKGPQFIHRHRFEITHVTNSHDCRGAGSLLTMGFEG
jgi:hypothetical protein